MFAIPVSFAGPAASGHPRRESGLYRDVFDQNIYYEGTQYLHLERLYEDLFRIRQRALDVNVFDEVPDSTFFTNRHGRERMSLEDLKRGPMVTSGPDPGGKWVITKGKFEGLTPGFFVQDQKGDKYLLKFDRSESLELATGAENIASRFMHAVGYNVPQYTLTYFKKDRFEIGPGAKVYDESGFRKTLTPERLEEFLLFLPETPEGLYRASASRILEGELLGPMRFQGRRKSDPNDLVNHEDRREIRALQVFASWLNNNDVRESNSLDVIEEKDGKSQIRHYFIDFNSSLGSTARGVKPPQFGYEYMLDYGETLKAIFTFGFWKKPWQKRWEEAGEEVRYPSIGYFDNRRFKPARFKTQLPYFAFKDLTRADGFWAAKIIMRFTDEEIGAIVSTGEITDSEAREELTQTLIERRDLIGRYWFKQTNPLEEFRLVQSGGGYELRFEDLAVRHRFEPEGKSVYRFDVIGREGRRGKRIAQEEAQSPNLVIPSGWLQEHPSLDLLIRTKREGEKEWSPFVRIEIRSENGAAHLAGILHQD
jgi:hypothetical protein